MRILLLSAYDADSHRYWHSGLEQQFPEHQWVRLSLPARYFSWRIRGNALSWAFGTESVHFEQPFDLLIATSMTDLATLRGFVPALSQVPTLLYFHENQFAYPTTKHTHPSVEPQITSLYSALCADMIAFNSEYNRQTFMAGVEALTRKLPDHVPSGLLSRLEHKSTVLPVPLSDTCFLPNQPQPGPLQIVWNHRWEYDKGPDALLTLLEALAAQALPITCHIVGQQFRQQPDAFKAIRQRFSHLLGHWGYLENPESYRVLLQQADVVLSTALHDFQGIAVLEAVAAGAVPAVPDRLAYRELFAELFRYSETSESSALTAMVIKRLHEKAAQQLPAAPCVKALSWKSLRPRYSALFAETLSRHSA